MSNFFWLMFLYLFEILMTKCFSFKTKILQTFNDWILIISKNFVVSFFSTFRNFCSSSVCSRRVSIFRCVVALFVEFRATMHRIFQRSRTMNVFFFKRKKKQQNRWNFFYLSVFLFKKIQINIEIFVYFIAITKLNIFRWNFNHFLNSRFRYVTRLRHREKFFFRILNICVLTNTRHFFFRIVWYNNELINMWKIILKKISKKHTMWKNKKQIKCKLIDEIFFENLMFYII